LFPTCVSRAQTALARAHLSRSLPPSSRSLARSPRALASPTLGAPDKMYRIERQIRDRESNDRANREI
ncbi:hypothetical protein L9F63_012604, partial [Diploptera punctata]